MFSSLLFQTEGLIVLDLGGPAAGMHLAQLSADADG